MALPSGGPMDRFLSKTDRFTFGDLQRPITVDEFVEDLMAADIHGSVPNTKEPSPMSPAIPRSPETPCSAVSYTHLTLPTKRIV